MTPAVRLLELKGIAHRVHRYHHDPKAESFGEEAAAKLGVVPERVFKTLVAMIDGTIIVMAVLPVAARLDLKKLATAVGGKKAELADLKVAEKTTGYVVGGISPLGGRKSLPTFLDETAFLFESVFISAGQRGLQIEISPTELHALTNASTISLSKE
ncbi:MAG: Cys-tRNA(Pro) deacylase [Gemmataceae bacterium]|nr:Cys-tRNA(Pro) deacylase [Gemmataceae bacterium]